MLGSKLYPWSRFPSPEWTEIHFAHSLASSHIHLSPGKSHSRFSGEQHPQSCSKDSIAPCRGFPGSGEQTSWELTPRQHMPQSHPMQQRLSELCAVLPLDSGISLGVRTGTTITQHSETKQASHLILGQIPLHGGISFSWEEKINGIGATSHLPGMLMDVHSHFSFYSP